MNARRLVVSVDAALFEALGRLAGAEGITEAEALARLARRALCEGRDI